jgi:hypothetical protein
VAYSRHEIRTDMNPRDPKSNLNKLLKWRSVLVGRLLGSRPADDPQCKGYRDLVDKLLILRVENTALTGLLIERGVFNIEEFMVAVEDEAALLDADYERQFPGFKTTHTGVDIDIVKAQKTMKGWPA